MKFSVVTVSYNSAAHIADTLKSVVAQTFPHFEHLIIDGASKDGTLEIVNGLAHERLRLISEPDGGIYNAMNKGLGLARGEYIIFLNSDDFFARPDALSLAADRIGETGADCIFGDTYFVGEDGVRRGGRCYSAKNWHPMWLRVGAMPPHPSMFVRRAALLEANGFDERFKIAADFDLIARLILKRGASWTKLDAEITRFRAGGVSTGGLGAKARISAELAASLRSLGQPCASLAVLFRAPLKVAQWKKRQSSLGAFPFFYSADE